MLSNNCSVNETDEIIDKNENVEVERKPVRTKLHVSNFPENCTRRNLTEFFSQFGQVLECAIMWDKYAFIHYGTMAEAQYALKKSNGVYFMGKRLATHLSTSQKRQNFNWYQQEAAKMEKELFGNLNNSNTENISVSPSSNFLVETKLYVTNLPDNCNQFELKSLFEQHGNVLECVIMWNHYAFVHFADLKEAKIALKHLHGHMFNGKNLIVQLSTSSNRPLPKCLAFGNKQNKKAKPLEENSINFQEKKSSTILCYRANDPSGINSNSSLNANEQQSSSTKDWIKLLKMGNVPVQISNQQDQSNTNSLPLNLNDVFSKPSENDTSKNENNSAELISFSGIPTPIMPDLTSKIPSSNKKIISKQEDNNINNFGFLSLATVKNELKRVNDISSYKNTETVKEKETCFTQNIDDILTKDYSSNTFGMFNSQSKFDLDEVPTPPLPIEKLNKTEELTHSENDLKKLINSINNSKKSPQKSNQIFIIEKPNADCLTVPDIDKENEQILIEKLNSLKYEAQLLNNLKISNQISNNTLVDAKEASLKTLWSQNQTNSNKFNLNFSSIFEQASSNEFASDTCIGSSCSSSSSGFPSSISSMASSTSVSPLTFDYLTNKCSYEENNILLKSLKTDSVSALNKDEVSKKTSKSTVIKKPQLTRCRVVNYLLFPELQEQNKAIKKE